jgi:hypothetical protein
VGQWPYRDDARCHNRRIAKAKQSETAKDLSSSEGVLRDGVRARAS